MSRDDPGSSLFLDAAIRASREARSDTITVVPPRYGWVVAAIGAVILLAGVLVFAFGGYDATVRARGLLLPDDGLVLITSQRAGVVARVEVKEGDAVTAGQPLFAVSGERDGESAPGIHAANARRLEQRVDALRQDLAAQDAVAAVELGRLKSKLALLHSQQDQLARAIAIQEQRADSAAALHRHLADSASTGAVSRSAILQQEDTALQLRGQLEDLRRQSLAFDAEIQSTAADIAAAPMTARTRANDLRRQLLDTEQALDAARSERATLVKAPVAGIVAGVAARQGDSVAADQRLLSIVPSGAELRANVFVPRSSVGQIHPGARVVLEYDSFPESRFGRHEGTVLAVSEAPLTRNDAERLTGSADPEAGTYRITIAIPTTSVAAAGISETLRPGLGVSARITTERRRFRDWLSTPGTHATPATGGARAANATRAGT